MIIRAKRYTKQGTVIITRVHMPLWVGPVFATVWKHWNPCALLVGRRRSASMRKSSSDLPQPTKGRATMWPSNCTPVCISKTNLHQGLKGPSLCQLQQHSGQPDRETTHRCISRGMGKANGVWTYNRTLALEKKQVLSFATTWVNLGTIMLSEIIGQSQKDAYHMFPVIYEAESRIIMFIETENGIVVTGS